MLDRLTQPAQHSPARTTQHNTFRTLSDNPNAINQTIHLDCPHVFPPPSTTNFTACSQLSLCDAVLTHLALLLALEEFEVPEAAVGAAAPEVPPGLLARRRAAHPEPRLQPRHKYSALCLPAALGSPFNVMLH